MRFVVTGASRSGTTYTAELLNALGFTCGHERVFNIYKVLDYDGDPQDIEGFDQYSGDTSFLAAPWLARLPAGMVVLHQLRDPLEVLRSHLGIRMFATPPVPSIYLADNHADFMRYIDRHCPGVLVGDEIERCMRYWIKWNRLVLPAADQPGLRYLRYRVEDLDVALVTEILDLIGERRSPDSVVHALEATSTTVNARARAEHLDWDALPDGPSKTEMVEMATAWGYPVSEVSRR